MQYHGNRGLYLFGHEGQLSLAGNTAHSIIALSLNWLVAPYLIDTPLPRGLPTLELRPLVSTSSEWSLCPVPIQL